MKAVVQRVQRASVQVDGRVVGEIGPGLMTLLGVEKGDSEDQLKWMVQKILDLRIFPDQAGKMNLSLLETGGGHLIVSQFTLAGDCSRGRRPAFTGAEDPERAKEFYLRAIELSQAAGVKTEAGEFGGDMKVELVNDGPVTLILER
ncbi:MAG: D-tyrosyl-tRNA(Tyr) deacylase [Bdellovibrionaceae bacterium]|nr:D-tyrosyl-tRNA(Tyr) deacylase [Bdellovibrionales bacterium]MCB9084217.1 D-tyrosyl-tRNA(Tyr) deacylase [Pseudobdellovibrionaceae bacterium]